MSGAQSEALRRIYQALLETVQEAGALGAPAGIMYAAVSAHGLSLDSFNQFMAVMVQRGDARRDGDCYIATKKEATQCAS